MLKVRQCMIDETAWFRKLEGEYHYMGESHGAGDGVRLVFEEDGAPVALMTWAAACYCLKARDERIGWNPAMRARRLKLVASNRRFTILAKPGERRNLASQCLALAAREIPGLWMRKFHYRPLLAETFCDIEHSAGTCYKAAGWTPLGMTKGFTRTNRQECDFYVPNDRPKTLWVKPLFPAASKSRDGARTEGGQADAHIQAGRPGPARHVRDAHARADPAPVGAPVRTEQGEPDESGNIVPRLDHRNRRTAWR
jgi:hypothetical protein